MEILAYELCLEIEKLPASEQQTKISIMASDLYRQIEGRRSTQERECKKHSRDYTITLGNGARVCSYCGHPRH